MVLSLALAVSGCVETVAEMKPQANATRIARREGANPRAASIALTGVEGAPDATAARFTAAFASAAPGMDIVTSDAKSAHYLVRGYLTASAASANTTRVTYVLDIFDRQKRRALRVNDELTVPGASADPWALVDERVLQSLASRSASDLADALSNTPEAIAGAAISTSTASASAPQPRVAGGTTSVPRSEPAVAQRQNPAIGFAAR